MIEMLLPGFSYSEDFVDKYHAYSNQWTNSAIVNVYKEVVDSILSAADEVSKDREYLGSEIIQEDLSSEAQQLQDLWTLGRKSFRLAKATAPLIVADGPLPVGDVIFAIALAIDLGLFAYEVYTNE